MTPFGALEHRDRAYLDWLAGGAEDGAAHVLHPLIRLGDWLHEVANTGCLSMNALAEYPESVAIAEAVRVHKARLAGEFRTRIGKIAPGADTGPAAETLFLLHEGLTDVARLQGPEHATAAALRAARTTLAAEGIP